MLHNFYTLLHIFSKDKSRLYPFRYTLLQKKDPPWDTDLTRSVASTIGYEAKILYFSYCGRDRSFQYPLRHIFQGAGDMRLQHPGLRLK